MPAEQRIIGGGLLVVGVLIAVILLAVFTGRSGSPTEAASELKTSIYPAYAAAEKQRDYLEMTRLAEKALEIIEDAGATAVGKLLQGEATSGTREDKRLYELVKDGVFEKNADGQFGLDGRWYRSGTHRGLSQVKGAVDQLKILSGIRETARRARQAIDEARKGSKLPLEVPPAADTPDHPVLRNDAEAFRVFGLRADELEKALAVPDPKGAATSARLLWNRDVAPGPIGSEVERIPEQVTTLRSFANDIEVGAAAVRSENEGAKELSELMARAARYLGAGLAEPHRAAYETAAASFEKVEAVTDTLRKEADLLSRFKDSARALGQAMTRKFQ